MKWWSTPFLGPGMGIGAAFQSGLRHGFEGFNTRGICTLTEGTAERAAWQLGFTLGESLSHPPSTPEETQV